MPALAVWTPEDGLAGALVPLGIAAAAPTALFVDLDALGPAYPGSATLARLVADGPRRRDLEPESRGIAVLSNGGIDLADATEVVQALIAGWPRVVLRLPPRPRPETPPAPVVPVSVVFVDLTAAAPEGVVNGYVGTGVNATAISRVYDDFHTQQVRNHGAAFSQLETLNGLIGQVGGLLGNADAGLSPALGFSMLMSPPARSLALWTL